MLIRKLVVKSFRGVVEGRIELSRMTLLVGPNNAGKTSVLEALLLLHGVENKVLGDLTVAEILSCLHATLNSQDLAHLLHRYVRRAELSYYVDGDRVNLVIERGGSILRFVYGWSGRLYEVQIPLNIAFASGRSDPPPSFPRVFIAWPDLEDAVYQQLYRSRLDEGFMEFGVIAVDNREELLMMVFATWVASHVSIRNLFKLGSSVLLGE